MTLLMDNSVRSAVCETVRLHVAKPAAGPELLFAYGGMRRHEIRCLLEHRHPLSRVFWITRRAETLSPDLRQIADEGRLAAVPADGPVEQTFFSFFDPKLKYEFVLLDAGRASDAHRQQCGKVLLSLREKVRLQVFNAGTLVTKGPLWQNNTLQNLPLILRSPGLETLTEAFSGRHRGCGRCRAVSGRSHAAFETEPRPLCCHCHRYCSFAPAPCGNPARSGGRRGRKSADWKTVFLSVR